VVILFNNIPGHSILLLLRRGLIVCNNLRDKERVLNEATHQTGALEEIYIFIKREGVS